MKYIYTLTLIILLAGMSRAESIPFVPQPIPAPTSARTLDDYSKISSKEEKQRLKLAAEQIKDLQNEFGDMKVYIVFYGEKRSALKRANRAKNYLVKTEGIESNKIFTVYGGDNKVWRISISVLPAKPPDTESNIDSSKEQDCQAKPKKPEQRVRGTARVKQFDKRDGKSRSSTSSQLLVFS